MPPNASHAYRGLCLSSFVSPFRMPYSTASAPNTDAPNINITPARPNAPLSDAAIMSSGHVVPGTR